MFSSPRVVGFAAFALAAALSLPTFSSMGEVFSSERPDTRTTDPTALRVYVPNQMGASISVLDGGGNVLTTVDLTAFGFSEHAMPHQVTASADDSAWYVTLAGDGYVAKFDGTHQLVAKTQFEAPGMIQVDRVRGRVYVSRALGAVQVPSSLGVFRTSDLTLLEETAIFIDRPHALAVDTTRGIVYSASLSGNQIAALNTETGRAEITDAPDAPAGFVGLAVSPDGRQVVATTQSTNRLLAFDASAPAHLEHIASVPVAAGPYDVVFSPDGQSVWFPNQHANRVTQVDTGTWTVEAVIASEAFQEPHGVVVAPDSRTVYVSSHGTRSSGERSPSPPGEAENQRLSQVNGTLVVIDAASETVRAVAEVGPHAAALGLSQGW